VPRTVIEEGISIQFQPYRSDSAGVFPLGPQGSFGLLRDGNPPTAPQGLNLEYSGLLTEPMFQAVLHALEISGKGRTLSVPRVTTLNNNPAKLRDGDDLLYYEEFQAQAFSLVDADNRKYTVTALIPKGVPKTAELGFTLIAVPSVGADHRTISLLLTPTISELLEFISYQEDRTRSELDSNEIRQVVVKLPRISRREVQTKVVVESGETVVMGGLVRTVSQETVRRVPFLGSLPLVGELFKRTDITEEQRNLIIFVTATVISERGESLVPVTGQSGR
jgi:type IV pilus assembly protein PilQ